MTGPFFYLADGKLFLHDGSANTEVHSGILDAYIQKVRSSAARSEWKYSGEGARFMGTYDPGSSVQSRLEAIRSEISCARFSDGILYYSLAISGNAGIYQKRIGEGADDGIILSTAEQSFRDFSILDGKIAVSAAFAGESHIGVCSLDRPDLKMMTEGRSYDTEPVWSPSERGKLYFCSAGLTAAPQAEEPEMPASLPQMVMQMQKNAASAVLRGPTSICALTLSDGALEEILSDERYDYLHPQCTQDGALCYIRRPYRQKKENRGGCLLDILLLPFRLVSALFGFFNLFSMKYSGKPLSQSGDVRKQDEAKLIIDGNLINAEKELRENTAKGDKNPGIIPRSWELHRKTPDGRDTLIRRGVSAFHVTENGDILCSNGSAVLCIHPDGTEEKAADIANVTGLL